jgi:cell division septum initiation protein DivIVA
MSDFKHCQRCLDVDKDIVKMVEEIKLLKQKIAILEAMLAHQKPHHQQLQHAEHHCG